MEYLIFKAVNENLEADMKDAELRMKKFPRLANGLHSDSVKADPEYKEAKKALDQAFASIRSFNGKYVKMFKNEIKADIQAKRMKAMWV